MGDVNLPNGAGQSQAELDEFGMDFFNFHEPLI